MVDSVIVYHGVSLLSRNIMEGTANINVTLTSRQRRLESDILRMLTRPTLLLRLEDAFLLATTVLLYAHFRLSWLLFAVLFFVPDISMLGYLANPRTGAALYNLGHWVALPLGLLAFGYIQHQTSLIAISLIWIGHVTFDRALGYGFKYPTAFKDTHIQRIS